MPRLNDAVSGDLSPVFTLGDMPLHMANYWLQTVSILQDTERESIDEMTQLALPLASDTDSASSQSRPQDLTVRQMAFLIDETLRVMQVWFAAIDSQIRWLRDVESGAEQCLHPLDERIRRASPDSAGGLLTPPDHITPANLVKIGSGLWRVMSQAWLTAVKHDLHA